MDPHDLFLFDNTTYDPQEDKINECEIRQYENCARQKIEQEMQDKIQCQIL